MHTYLEVSLVLAEHSFYLTKENNQQQEQRKSNNESEFLLIPLNPEELYGHLDHIKFIVRTSLCNHRSRPPNSEDNLELRARLANNIRILKSRLRGSQSNLSEDYLEEMYKISQEILETINETTNSNLISTAVKDVHFARLHYLQSKDNVATLTDPEKYLLRNLAAQHENLKNMNQAFVKSTETNSSIVIASTLTFAETSQQIIGNLTSILQSLCISEHSEILQLGIQYLDHTTIQVVILGTLLGIGYTQFDKNHSNLYGYIVCNWATTVELIASTLSVAKKAS